jgi:hypothetical protein
MSAKNNGGGSVLLLLLLCGGFTGLIVTAPTETNQTLKETSLSMSIHRGGFAGYMPMPQPSGTWNTPVAQAFAIDSFDAMVLGSYQWSNITAPLYTTFNIAGMHTYGYQRFAQVEYSPTPEYCSPDWITCNANEDWFIHDDVTGGRIWNPSDDGVLMDIGNAGFRAHWISFMTAQLASYTGIKNIFIDNAFGMINPTWVPWVRFSDGGAVTFKAADIAGWYATATAFLNQIKTAFPTYNIIINIDSVSYPEYVAEVDGVMIEGFTHASWQDHNTYSAAVDVIALIDYFKTVSEAGKTVWYISGSSDGSTTEVNALVQYCYVAALLSNGDPSSIFSFNNWFSFDDSYGYYPILDTNIGAATGAYYSSQNVYMREFDDGLILFNPSVNNYNIVLAGYKFLSDGSDADAFTLNAHTATILVPDAETVVYPATTTLSLSAVAVKVDTPVVCTATLTGEVGAPTGTVLFYTSSDSGLTWLQFGIARTLSAGTVDSIGYYPATAGTYLFKADYSGDANYYATSNSIAFTVNNPVVVTAPATLGLLGAVFTRAEQQNVGDSYWVRGGWMDGMWEFNTPMQNVVRQAEKVDVGDSYWDRGLWDDGMWEHDTPFINLRKEMEKH